MASTESSQNIVRGPAKRPEWAQLIRLGGDRVAVLFEELRKSIGKIDGIIERLHYSSGEGRWVVRYSITGKEPFVVRISPGSLEAVMPLTSSEAEMLLRSQALRRPLRDAINTRLKKGPADLMSFPLTDRRTACSFANLIRAKCRLKSEDES